MLQRHACNNLDLCELANPRMGMAVYRLFQEPRTTSPSGSFGLPIPDCPANIRHCWRVVYGWDGDHPRHADDPARYFQLRPVVAHDDARELYVQLHMQLPVFVVPPTHNIQDPWIHSELAPPLSSQVSASVIVLLYVINYHMVYVYVRHCARAYLAHSVRNPAPLCAWKFVSVHEQYMRACTSNLRTLLVYTQPVRSRSLSGCAPVRNCARF